MLADLMPATRLFYIRFMDDWLVLASTRWSLRKAVRIVNQTGQQHPDKTFNIKTDRGFSFLGYAFNEHGLVSFVRQTRQNSTNEYALTGNQPHFMSKVRVSLAALASTLDVG